MARPSKLTDEVQKQIVKAIAAGAYGEVAAEAAGIGKTTFYRWLSEGKRRKRGRFQEFRDAIKKAQARGEHADLATIRKRAQGGAIIEERTITRKDGTTEKIIRRSRPEWTPIAWIMERRHAERWGRK